VDPDPRLVAASERLRTAIAEVRTVLAGLLPPGLDELGLAGAIRTRLDAEGGAVAGAVGGDLPRLQPSVEQALYGMTAEAISNAVRHGGAAAIRVDLAVVRERAVIVVTDDGRGFDPATVARSARAGLGLIGMSRQAAWLGGSARISSRDGRGTTIRISIPLARHRRPPAGDAGPAGATGRGRERAGSTRPRQTRDDQPAMEGNRR
jgi:signal transduction histidine kinase